MSRLIDADALIDDLKHDVAMDQDSLDYEELTDSNREIIQFDKDCKQNAIDLLQNAPTIEERKTGKWVESDTDGFVCSVCRNGYRCQPTLMGKPMFEYCPVCGAKMEG